MPTVPAPIGRSQHIKLSLREDRNGGIEEDRIWATRMEPMNPYKLRDDSFVGAFRFAVAYEKDVDMGTPQVWVECFTLYDDACAFMDHHAGGNIRAALFAILPIGFGT